jgi:hypothetical protein
MENFPGGEGHCCRLIVGMQRSPQEELRRSLSLLKNGERLSNKEVNRLVRVATEEFREQLQIGAPTDTDEKGLRRLSAQLRAKKLLVRLYLREPLHAKLYLIHRDNPNLPAVGFVGSSNPEWKCGLEVEAGRKWMGNAVYRDLVQAAVMVGVDYLCLAVANVYRYRSSGKPAASRDYANTLQVAEAIYGHSRLRLPYNLVLIGY